MFAITGVTGNVGGEMARTLLAAKQPVRAVVRDLGKGTVWAERGCEVAVADIGDASALAAAFQGVEGVFVLVPPNFDPAPGFPEAQVMADVLRSALERARPKWSRLPLDDRSAGDRGKPPLAAHDYRARPW